MRVFPDTNVLVSGLMGRGLCRDLLDQILVEHDLIIGSPVREELRRILAQKFAVPVDVIADVDRRLDGFEQAGAVPKASAVSISDPDDVHVIACALAAAADLFVTGDKALLDLKRIEGMLIVSPRQCWDRLRAAR